MMNWVDPQHTRIDHHELAVRAAAQYQLNQALREAKERRRAERKSTRSPSGRRYFGLIPRRTSATLR